jgi:predicted 3-demethylubiquinone-9 3-methyltransferase (glyoxalase superfamily)
MQKIIPFLCFDGKAQEAANFYVSIFKNSSITHTDPMSTTFQLDGQDFYALNSGLQFKFTEAISMFVNCETQPEVDELWTKLSAGGSESRCGWLKDKYGLSWQIIPTILMKLMRDKDPKKSKAVFNAMLTMGKIDIKKIQEAYDNA